MLAKDLYQDFGMFLFSFPLTPLLRGVRYTSLYTSQVIVFDLSMHVSAVFVSCRLTTQRSELYSPFTRLFCLYIFYVGYGCALAVSLALRL